MADLQTIEFAGATLDVVPDPQERTWWVSLRRACEGIGIKYSTQRRKLTSEDAAHWANVTTMNVVDAAGRSIEMTMIDRATMLRWLVTIAPGRVSDDARETLIAFQAHCVDVLDRHFFGDDEPMPVPVDSAPEAHETHEVVPMTDAEAQRIAERIFERADGSREIRRYREPHTPEPVRITPALAWEMADKASDRHDVNRRYLRQLRAALLSDCDVDGLRKRFHAELRRALRHADLAGDLDGSDQRAGAYRMTNKLLLRHVGKPRESWKVDDYARAVRWLEETHEIDLWSIFENAEVSA